MYINSACWRDSRLDHRDRERPLHVSSCGTCQLLTRSVLSGGSCQEEPDFQLLYIASGKAQVFFGGADQMLTAGHMVLCRPREEQHCRCYGADQTEVYWVRFAGRDAAGILRQYGIADLVRVIYTGSAPEYRHIFARMIQELQLCREGYEELLVLLLRQIFLLIRRQLTRRARAGNQYMEGEIERAVKYFLSRYNTPLSIEEYAASRGLSASWFIRSFKEFTGFTPMQYILFLRMTNAQNLLETTRYNVAEIGGIVGYENPLYFSRMFKKQVGVSPTEFRQQLQSRQAEKQSLATGPAF